MGMYFSERITLVSVKEKKDERGDIAEAEVKTEAWADMRSATRAEFYQAQTAGLKAEITFELWRADYEGQERIQHAGEVYDVIRTFIKDADKIEVVCKRGVR